MNSIVGLLRDKHDRFEIEPMVIGTPWFDHPRNGSDATAMMVLGRSFGEILPEDIDQFSRMRNVKAENADEWMAAMRGVPEANVKKAIAHFSVGTNQEGLGRRIRRSLLGQYLSARSP